MKTSLFSYFLLFVSCLASAAKPVPAAVGRTIPFDANWLFLRASVTGAEQASYNDASWRQVNLPHDWSIEDLPRQVADSTSGPFSKSSVGKAATGFTVGGIGWYRKKFTTGQNELNKLVTIHFDGVYMNAEVWLNGQRLGLRPSGYMPFEYELTPYLKPAGQENVLAVQVRNEGKNSRWYSGSGIYRHVWLTVTDPVHVGNWGVAVTTPQVSTATATVHLATTLNNQLATASTVSLVTTIYSPDNKRVSETEKSVQLPAKKEQTAEQDITVAKPVLWSMEQPRLYRAVTEIKAGKKTIDRVETAFGIRSLRFDGNGFALNGQHVILKGGCIHHDNGPLGAAAFDRAEERKIELLKQVGYNAIRSSHQPPSQALLDACDRLGMLVMDEAFDMWELSKNKEDNHLYFKEWWKKDVGAMVQRDRNHPSVIMWSIGNEIFEASDSSGYRIARQLATEVRRLDPSRPVTSAVVYLPGFTNKPWTAYEPFLANLDVDGYNYFLEEKDVFFKRDSATAHRFGSEHAKHPQKAYAVTEYLPNVALANFDISEKAPYVIGAFKWTAMDYIGEAGIGKSLVVPQAKKMPTGLIGIGMFYRNNWPVFNAYCGDLDLIGTRKAPSYYQDVVWRNSPVELLVHQPIPDGMREAVATWGFPEEHKSWTWPGQEGKPLLVHVYTRSKTVRLELNGKVVAEQTVPAGSITATFEVPYQPGTLVAKSYEGDQQTGSSTLTTNGKPVAVRLVADRTTLKANLGDLSYVQVEIVDEQGRVVPYVDDIDVSYQLTGEGTIAAVGSGSPTDASSFQQNHKKVYQGRGLVILRPTGTKGAVTLKATAPGLKESSLQLKIK